MNILFAHHVEAQHIPVLVCLFAAGCFVGWQCMSRWLTRSPAARPEDVGHSKPKVHGT